MPTLSIFHYGCYYTIEWDGREVRIVTGHAMRKL